MQLPAADIVRAGVVRTFQNKRLFSNISVLDNVLAAALLSASGSTIGDVLGLYHSREALRLAENRARDSIEKVGLTEMLDLLAKDLPYGAQNRLEIARTLALSPKLLLLDEPAAGLNPSERTEIVDLIHGIHQSGITIALVEHYMKIVSNLCSRIAVLDHGEKIADGPTQEIIHNPKVLEAYFGIDDGMDEVNAS